MNDVKIESHMLLSKVEAAVSEVTGKAEIPVTTRPFALTEDAEKLRAAFEEHVRKVFDHGLARIKAVRHACDVAEETLRNKCERVLESQAGLVYTIQEVDRTTDEMQKKLGDLLVATDQV